MLTLRARRWVVVLASALLLGACGDDRRGGGADEDGNYPAQGEPPPPLTDIDPNAEPSAPEGAQGIEVEPGAFPGFSAEAAARYAAEHRVPMSIGAEKSQPVQALFVTNATAESALGTRTGLDASTPVCVVQLEGDFEFRVPASDQSVKYRHAYQLFDARTGNLLVAGGQPEEEFAAALKLMRAKELSPKDLAASG